jgi:hypothetical protein
VTVSVLVTVDRSWRVMLSLEEDVEAHALRAQGWSVSAIARHLGPFEPFVGYCRARLADDPHLWASTLLDEITDPGCEGGCSTFTQHVEPLSAAAALGAVPGNPRP